MTKVSGAPPGGPAEATPKPSESTPKDGEFDRVMDQQQSDGAAAAPGGTSAGQSAQGTPGEGSGDKGQGDRGGKGTLGGQGAGNGPGTRPALVPGGGKGLPRVRHGGLGAGTGSQPLLGKPLPPGSMRTLRSTLPGGQALGAQSGGATGAEVGKGAREEAKPEGLTAEGTASAVGDLGAASTLARGALLHRHGQHGGPPDLLGKAKGGESLKLAEGDSAPALQSEPQLLGRHGAVAGSAASGPTAPAHDPALVRQVAQQVLAGIEVHMVAGRQQVDLGIDLGSLGMARVELTRSGGEVGIAFRLDTAEAQQAVQQNLPELVKALEQRGLTSQIQLQGGDGSPLGGDRGDPRQQQQERSRGQYIEPGEEES